ncbi:MAG: low molecular weight protein-tyrosine-phosphatase [Thermodesulfobacteriota bacterium]
MVCLGNICRSPLAEGIMKSKISMMGLNWEVDSAGTSSWHEGELPDQRSIKIAKENGIDLTSQRSRKFDSSDFDHFDHILTMDTSNFQNIRSMAKLESHINKIDLIMNYAYPNENRVVPDPYYNNGFSEVFEMLDTCCNKFIELYSNH